MKRSKKKLTSIEKNLLGGMLEAETPMPGPGIGFIGWAAIVFASVTIAWAVYFLFHMFLGWRG